MKNRVYLIFATLLALAAAVLPASAQQVKWSAETEKLADDLYRVVVTADIDKGWHMYDLGPYESEPNPTVIIFWVYGGEVDGPGEALTAAHRYFDEVYGCEIGTYEGKAQFAQRVRLPEGSDGATVTVSAEWMVCNDESCMPPDYTTFMVTIGAAAQAAASAVTPATVAPVKDAAGSGMCN